MILFSKYKIVLAVLALLAVVGLAFWAYPVIKERYFTQNITEKETGEKEKNEWNKEESAKNSEENALPEENEKETEPVKEDEPFFEVTLKDCSEKCKKYEKDAEGFEYCRHICGLSTEKATISDCSDLEGLAKDYCWKNLAIFKLDFKICERIADSGIKRSCTNRITEEILNDTSKNRSLLE